MYFMNVKMTGRETKIGMYYVINTDLQYEKIIY